MGALLDSFHRRRRRWDPNGSDPHGGLQVVYETLEEVIAEVEKLKDAGRDEAGT